jgi:osmoprotectant transport system substrate-binding protein
MILTGACSDTSDVEPSSALGDEAITVASFDFAESEVLAELYAHALEANGFEVERALGVGPRELVEPALELGLIEFVPEYMGTALEFLNRGAGEASADVPTTYRALIGRYTPRGIVPMDPAPAQDANGIAVTRETASTHGLREISDLATVDHQLTLGGPAECPARPLCLQGLERAYGLRFERFLALDASGPLTAAALEMGQIQVAVLFTTSGYIAEHGFVPLEDDRGLQPAENVVPVVRAEVIRRSGGRLREVVDSVSRLLTTEDLTVLNRKVSLEGGEPAAVALHWLQTKGIVD